MDLITHVRKILVVRLGAMGDIVHTLPAVAQLKSKFPNAHVTWVIASKWKPLLDDNPDVDEVVTISLTQWRRYPGSLSTWSSFRAFCDRFRQSEFDVAIDFQGLLKSAAVTYISGAKRVVGVDRKVLRERTAALFYSDHVLPHSKHVVDQNRDLTMIVGASKTPAIFSLPSGQCSPLLPDGEFVLTAPIAGWMSKQWPAKYYTELARLIWRDRRMPLVLDCAPQDSAYVEQICVGAPKGSCIVHNSSLKELIAATRQARAVVGVDSGPLHLAAALNVPGVAIYGPTDPVRNGPYGNSFHLMRSHETTTSYKRSEVVHPSMLRVKPDQVWKVLKSVLDSHPVDKVRS